MLSFKVKKAFALLLTLLFAFSITISVSAVSLNVYRIQQQKSNWCWAAAGEMIGKYANFGARTQWDAVANIKGSNYPNVTGTIWDVEKAIEYVSYGAVNAYAGLGNKFTAGQAASKLSANKPFAVHMAWDLFSGHIVVCDGSAGNELRLVDPAEGCSSKEWYDRDALVSGTSILSGNGKYVDTIYLT